MAQKSFLKPFYLMRGRYYVRIQLPDGRKTNLEDDISFAEKKRKVLDLIKEWKDVCLENWHSNSVKYFLDSLTNYLLWHKGEDVIKDDNEDDILSRHQLLMMNRRTDDRRKELPAGDLSNFDVFVHNYEETKKRKLEIKDEVEKSKKEIGDVKVWKKESPLN